MTYAKDSLGRSTGRRFNMAAMTREIKEAQAAFVSFEHKGFEVSGNAGQWFVSNWPTIYTSKQKAIEAIENCLSLRAMLAEAN